MKNTFALSFLLVLTSALIASAQIGVNTNEPTANLDVNGTLRVRSLEKTANGFQANGTVLYIMGVDEKGNVVPIEIGENIILKDNKLEVEIPADDTSIDELPDGETLSDNYAPGEDALINDLDLGIVLLPGGRQGRNPVIRLKNGTNEEKVKITGFKAVEDGTMAFIYATSGEIELKINDENSLEENRIIAENDRDVKKNEMLLLMYDGLIKRWVIVSRH